MNRRDALKTAGSAFVLAATGGHVAAEQPSEPYAPLGSVDVLGATEAVVNDDGTTAYVASNGSDLPVESGFVVVDINDPSNPTVLVEKRNLLADHENGPLQEIQDVKVEEDRLVVAGPANAMRGEVVMGFLLYDVSDPANPQRLAFHETDFPIHNCLLSDGIVYLTGNDGTENGLVMVDISDDTPERVGQWSLRDHDEQWESIPLLHDIWVQNGTAYLAYWEGGAWIVDVSDPADPTFVARAGGVPREEFMSVPEDEQFSAVMELPGNAHYVTVNDDASLLGVGAEAWDLPETELTGGPGGIDLWDLSTVESPTKVATIDAPPTPDPSLSGTWTTSHNFDIVGDRLYSSWYQGGVKVHDISDPANPEELAWWREPREASFWTAKLARDFFVASSTDLNDERGALYTFPDRAGTQTMTTATTRARTSTIPATDSTESESVETDEASSTTNGGGQPGFGVLAALGGLALGARRYLGRGE